jgi:hypothetical protein
VIDFYSLERADARLPELTERLLSLRSLKADVVALRDRIAELGEPIAIAGVAPGVDSPTATMAAEGARLRLRMQGLIDQMVDTVARLDEWNIQLRDIETGLVDFPALVAGRQVWLCWRLGEDHVGWWHELSEGFGGRRRIEDLV